MTSTDPVQRHRRIAAKLHMVIGVLGLIILVPAVVFFWSIGGRSGRSPDTLELVFVGLATALIPGVQILAGLWCLRGSLVARICLVGISLLIVLSLGLTLTFFPLAVVGGYAVWALLRDDAPTSGGPAASP